MKEKEQSPARILKSLLAQAKGKKPIELLKLLMSQQFFSYLVVGALATIVEWGIFGALVYGPRLFKYRMPDIAVSIIIPTIAYVISTYANLVFGRMLTFKDAKINKGVELVLIYLVSAIGLAITLGLMTLFYNVLHIVAIIAKMLCTCIVFFWNYLARKLFIYRKKEA